MYDVKPVEEKTAGIEKTMNLFGAVGNFVFGGIQAVVIALALSVFLYFFLLTPHEVVGKSMFPNFENGQFLLANKIVYRFSPPEHGDVIIFKHSETQDYIKRIIGVPGDTVGLKDGAIYINGKKLDESEYLASTVYTNGGQFLHEGETITIPEGQYFACGDNRPYSSDSRDFGPIEAEAIKGRVWIIFFPFSDFRIVEHARYK